MDTHWRALDRCRPVFEAAGYRPESVLGNPPVTTRSRSRFVQAFSKYIDYPRRVSRLPAGSLVHLFDHSFAFLLPHLPKGCRSIVTVHDLVPLMDPSHLTTAQVERFRRNLLNLKCADQLLADSDFTAQKIGELLGIPDSKIQMFPMGVELERGINQPKAFLPPIQLLSIGGTHARKNLKVLPAIVAGLIRRGHGIKLMRVGERLPADLAGQLRLSLGDHFWECGPISDEEVKQAYQQSDILIFPSYLEGFGLPVLEAMAQDCLVVSSNASSLPEVGGEAALYFSPEDPDTAASQIERLIREPELRELMRARGRRRIAEFEWTKHAHRLTQIYDAVENRGASEAGIENPSVGTDPGSTFSREVQSSCDPTVTESN